MSEWGFISSRTVSFCSFVLKLFRGKLTFCNGKSEWFLKRLWALWMWKPLKFPKSRDTTIVEGQVHIFFKLKFCFKLADCPVEK